MLDEPISASERQLLDAIAAAPREEGPRLVYADWLQGHGAQPLGRLITVVCERRRLQQEGVEGPALDRLVTLERELLVAPELALVGLIADSLGPQYDHVVIARLELEAAAVLDHPHVLERFAAFTPALVLRSVVWPHVCTLGQRGDLHHFRLLELTDATYGVRIQQPVLHAPLTRLEAMGLDNINVTTADVDQLFGPGMPALRNLRLHSVGFDTGAFAHFVELAPPSLKKLRIIKGGCYEVELAALLRLGLDALEIRDAWVPPLLAVELKRSIPHTVLRPRRRLGIG